MGEGLKAGDKETAGRLFVGIFCPDSMCTHLAFVPFLGYDLGGRAQFYAPIHPSGLVGSQALSLMQGQDLQPHTLRPNLCPSP